jgi:hypothetical protein
MKRSELIARLRELYVAHQGTSAFPYMHRACDWCDRRMARVMEAVDEYVTALSAGPPASRYRQGSIIREDVPHPEFPGGAKRWRVWDVRGEDYLVQALFSDGSPRVSLWNIGLCEAQTKLEWQDDEVGRVGLVMRTPVRMEEGKETDGDTQEQGNRQPGARGDAGDDRRVAEGEPQPAVADSAGDPTGDQ